jgi:hypothetical protein
MAASEAAAAAIAAEQTLGVVISHVLAEEDQQTEKRRKRGERERKSKRERERERAGKSRWVLCKKSRDNKSSWTRQARDK